jgi:hypothetical protein
MHSESSQNNLSQQRDASGKNILENESPQDVQPGPNDKTNHNHTESEDSKLSNNSHLNECGQPSTSETHVFEHVPSENVLDHSGIQVNPLKRSRPTKGQNRPMKWAKLN